MYRTVGVITALMLFVCLLTSCNNQIDNKYIQYLGETQEDVFTALNLPSDQILDMGNGMWQLAEGENIGGKPFTPYLLFHTQDNWLYAVDFVWYTSAPTENDYMCGMDFVNLLTEQYGDPNTYPGLINRLSELNHFSDLNTKIPTDYLETWKTTDGIDITLRYQTLLDGGLKISVQYCISSN